MSWRHAQGVDYRALPILVRGRLRKRMVYYPQYRVNGGEWQYYTDRAGNVIECADLHRVGVFFGKKGIGVSQWKVSKQAGGTLTMA